jgi:ankyrin repeat protein
MPVPLCWYLVAVFIYTSHSAIVPIRPLRTLVLAVSSGIPRTVKFLLDKGADPRYFGPALEAAARCGHYDVAKLLLSRGVDVNFVGGSYGSAIKAARGNRRHRIVQLLLENGAEPEEDN